MTRIPVSPRTSRRAFLQGAAALTAAAAGPRLAFAADGGSDAALFVHVHLRGGLDGLSLVVPRRGADRAAYEAARPTLAVAARELLALDADLGLHAAAGPLLEPWTAGDLAVLPAVGAPHPPRDAAGALRAFAGDDEGWLTRHLLTAPERHDEVFLPALALGRDAVSFDASTGALHAESIADLGADLDEITRDAVAALQGEDELGRQTAAAVEIAAWLRAGEHELGSYPDTILGRRLAAVAAADREGLGLRVAAIDMPGWAAPDGFAARVTELADALHALWLDASRRGRLDRLVVVVESEAGRSLAETTAGRTHLGHAAPMLVLGGGVEGGLHGGWPGLGSLSNGGVRPTVDREAVLADVLEHHLGNAGLARALRAGAATPAPRLIAA
ncbi:MAG: DUF1501 domain-containing protein [Acidobacteriota bacterium]